MIVLLCAVQVSPEGTFYSDLIKLGAGFVLTTVCGGILGWLLQWMSWAHQNRVRLREVEYNEAAKLFDEVSRLMDKRFYRTVRLIYAIATGAPREELKGALEKHYEARDEWNTSLNRNLARTESYFDPGIRQSIDSISNVYFQEISNQIEDFASAQLRRNHDGGSNIDVSPDLVLKTKALNEKMPIVGRAIYNVNAAMIKNLRNRQQGLLKPKKIRRPD
jgi:hypothetical protein